MDHYALNIIAFEPIKHIYWGSMTGLYFLYLCIFVLQSLQYQCWVMM